MKEEFKLFVKKRPELIKYVNSGKMTWQKFYEQWSLYGEDENIWKEYKTLDNINKESDSFNISTITNMLKKIDMNQVKKGVNSLQKVVELLQSIVLKDSKSPSKDDLYEPRQLFKKFED